MIRSMSTAVTGLRGHQQKLDVIGNNIANVNTVAFKRSQARFEDLFSQTIQGATAPLTRGGINPSQVGMGMRVSSIVNIHSQGAITNTDRITDLAIEGGGFFVVSPDGGNRFFHTRDGSFGRDANGDLVNANGMKLMGWQPGPGAGQGVPGTVMNVPLGDSMVARATTNINFSGNLDAARGGSDAVVAATTGTVNVGANFLSGIAQTQFQYDLTYTTQQNASITINNFNTAVGADLTIEYGGLDAGAANVTINFVEDAIPANEGALWSIVAGSHVLTVTMTTGTNYDASDLQGIIRSAGEAVVGANPVEDGLNFNVTSTGAVDNFILAATDAETATLALGANARWDAAVGAAPPFATNLYDPAIGPTGGFGTLLHQGVTADLDVLTNAATGDTITVDGGVSIYTYEYYLYDSLGQRYTVDFTFESVNQNTWNYGLQVNDQQGNPVAPVLGDAGTLIFDTNGALNVTASTMPNIQFGPRLGANLVDVEPQFGTITQLAGNSTLLVRQQDGYAAGELVAFNIDRSGMIVGIYSNGLFDDLGQIAMSYFSNPEGLIKEGGNLYMETANSGDMRIGLPGTEGRGLISSSSLEMSNTDLAYEFTELITTSRGFQANTRVVTTSDEVLVEVINMKR